MGYFNAHSLVWNSFCHVRHRADTLEDLFEKYDWLLNNVTSTVTQSTNGNGKSVIDLTFTNLEICTLEIWCIDPEVTTPSDHEIIIFEWRKE